MIQKYNVARLRSRLGLNKELFADKLGVSRSSVEIWEQGKHTAGGMALRALERLTKLSRRKVAKR